MDNKNEILKLLSDLWSEYPNQRLGQLLENYVFNTDQSCMFYQSDMETLRRLKIGTKQGS